MTKMTALHNIIITLYYITLHHITLYYIIFLSSRKALFSINVTVVKTHKDTDGYTLSRKKKFHFRFIDHLQSGVVYTFGRVCPSVCHCMYACMSVCQTMTFESLDVGTSC